MIKLNFLLLAAFVLLAVAARAMADDGYDSFDSKKYGGGPCPGGYWPDGNGCCPVRINGQAYYRDYENKCYPRKIKHSVYYADAKGCYPDEKGVYNPAGKHCPKDQECHPRCLKPDGSWYDEDCYETTTKKQETTTRKQETTTQKHETTTEFCPEETTTRKQETTTKKQETTTPRQETTTRKQETTTQRQETTTQKHETEPRGPCPGGKWPDGCDCCPRKIDYSFFYRDGRGCYPIKTEKGVLYADGNGCYPDNKGNYLKAGEHCPKDRQCCEECDRCN